MPNITTQEMISMKTRVNEYDQKHYDSWLLNYGTWFRDMIGKFDSNSLAGTRYLYSKSISEGKAGCTLCLAHQNADALEFSLGWMHELDPSYYWSLYAYLVDTYPDRLVTADVSNSLIWVR
jgi:hypothetical protein